MDFSSYEPMLREQAKINTELSIALVQLQTSNPEAMQAIGKPLEDGSIDPGDFEEVSSHLLKFLTEQPSYKATVAWAKSNRAKLADLFAALRDASDEDFGQYVELTQKVVIDNAVDTMFGMLVQAGMIEDKRGS